MFKNILLLLIAIAAILGGCYLLGLPALPAYNYKPLGVGLLVLGGIFFIVSFMSVAIEIGSYENEGADYE